MGTIRVKDANGDEFTVYEFQDRRCFRKVRRLKLCTGEIVEGLGDELFIANTGERLERTGD